MGKTSLHLSGVRCQLEPSHPSQLPSSAACPPPGEQPFARVEPEVPQDLTPLFTLPGIPIHPNLFSLQRIPDVPAHCSHHPPPPPLVWAFQPAGDTRVPWQTPASMVIAVCAVLEVYWCSTSPKRTSLNFHLQVPACEKNLDIPCFLTPCSPADGPAIKLANRCFVNYHTTSLTPYHPPQSHPIAHTSD